MRVHTRRFDRIGLSLMEVVIAVFIMAVVFIPLGTLIFGGVRGSEQSRTMAVAVNLATDVMEQLLNRNVPFSAVIPEGGPAVQGGFKGGLKQAGFATVERHDFIPDQYLAIFERS